MTCSFTSLFNGFAVIDDERVKEKLKRQTEDGWTDGWMDGRLVIYVPLTVFQSYQDDLWVIMKGCVRQNRVYD